MEQHPIPQQISSYEFKLVGEMTLKQFGKLAVGIVLGLILFSSGFPFLIKWFLIILCVGGGAASAFVPYQDRPLEVWFSYLIKRVYSPTIYLYRKKSDPNWLDLNEQFKMGKKKKKKVEMKAKGKVSEFISSLPEEDVGTGLGKIKINKRKAEVDEKEKLRRKYESGAEKLQVIETKTGTKKIVEKAEKIPQDEVLPEEQGVAGLDLQRRVSQATADAEHSRIPMPKTPSIPNIIVGMVFDEGGKIVESAIVEVQDLKGNPMRALRTNALGQFQTASPLRSEEYVVITEKEGISFDILKIKLTGKIVQPIKIKARSAKILN